MENTKETKTISHDIRWSDLDDATKDEVFNLVVEAFSDSELFSSDADVFITMPPVFATVTTQVSVDEELSEEHEEKEIQTEVSESEDIQKELYKKVLRLLRLAWKDDDYMFQETMLKVQRAAVGLALVIENNEIEDKSGGIYTGVRSIMDLAWENDCSADQETLFRMQEAIADLALLIAEDNGWVSDLIKEFPWIYEED